VIHSQLHYLIDEMRQHFNETARKGKGSFGFYLGILKRVPIQKLYEFFSLSKQPEVKNSKKLFWWLVKQELDKVSKKLSPRKFEHK